MVFSMPIDLVDGLSLKFFRFCSSAKTANPMMIKGNGPFVPAMLSHGFSFSPIFFSMAARRFSMDSRYEHATIPETAIETSVKIMAIS
jgi:hypothetical protein